MAPQDRKIIFCAVKRIKKVESSIVWRPKKKEKEEALAQCHDDIVEPRVLLHTSGISVQLPLHKFLGLAIVQVCGIIHKRR